MKTINILELFAGISSATMALKNKGYEVSSLPIEIDKKIMDVSNLLHDEKYVASDIKRTNKYWGEIIPNDFDIAVVGFPCQDISSAGKQAGMVEGTRSSLIWEAVRILKDAQPNLIIFENVKMFASKKYDWARAELIHEFTELGYKFDSRILNAKDYGIPQNRERLFIIFRKDNKAVIPYGFKKMKPLVDFLEEDKGQFDWKKVIVYKEFTNFIVIPRAKDNQLINGNYNRLWKVDKQVGTLSVINIPKISFPVRSAFYKYYKPDKYTATLRCTGRVGIVNHNYSAYRYLTPRESFKLMGWKDEQIDKVIHLSKKTLYRAAGNAIVIPVLEAIFQVNLEEETQC